DARNLLAGKRFGARTRRQAHGARLGRRGGGGRRGTRGSRARLADAKRAARAIEQDHVTGIDEVGILDVVPVHAPELGPPPRRVRIATGDRPQGVAGDDYVAVRRIRLERQWRGRRLRHSAKGDEEENESCDRLTQLLHHGDPVPSAAFRTGWFFELSVPM